MFRILRILIIATVALVLTTPTWAVESEEEQKIVNIVKETWKKAASKEVSDGMVGPKGSIQAHSSGGLWMALTPEAMATTLKESPNTMQFTPHHINVKLLGSKKDVAYVTYYLVGTIVREGKEDIPNYRTRASNVMEKIDGKWVNSASHFSALFGGSGVVFD
jgi:hypothetical protein